LQHGARLRGLQSERGLSGRSRCVAMRRLVRGRKMSGPRIPTFMTDRRAGVPWAATDPGERVGFRAALRNGTGAALASLRSAAQNLGKVTVPVLVLGRPVMIEADHGRHRLVRRGGANKQYWRACLPQRRVSDESYRAAPCAAKLQSPRLFWRMDPAIFSAGGHLSATVWSGLQTWMTIFEQGRIA